jgi:hypothetical protein
MSTVTEVNCETGETVIRDMTSEELAAQETMREHFIAAEAAKAQEEEAKAAAKASAEAKLTALGLTAEEISNLFSASTDVATDAEVSAVSAQIPANMAGKNFVINGGMDIWQRGTSFAVSGLGYASYTIDRWSCYAGGSGSITQDTSLFAPGCRYGLRFTATASGGQNWYQMIETANSATLAGKTVTLSGYAAGTSGVTGNYLLLWYSTNSDAGLFDAGWTACTTVATTLNPAISGTMQRYASVYSVPSNAKSLRVQWTTGALTNTQFQTISGFQLEIGSVATPFSRAGGDIEGELAKCQRYYEQSFIYGLIGHAYSSTQFAFNYRYSIQKRVVPSVSMLSATSYNLYSGNATPRTMSSIGSNLIHSDQVQFLATVSNATTAGYSCHIDGGVSNAIVINAEL